MWRAVREVDGGLAVSSVEGGDERRSRSDSLPTFELPVLFYYASN